MRCFPIWNSCAVSCHRGWIRKASSICITFPCPSWKKYSQLDKEALAIVLGVKKFLHYLFGRYFTISSDHKTLQQIFSENHLIPSLAATKIQCWAQVWALVSTTSINQDMQIQMLTYLADFHYQKWFRMNYSTHGNFAVITNNSHENQVLDR